MIGKQGASSEMKGSVEIMEYMFLTLFTLVVIIAFVLFLSWWQVSQLNVEKSKLEMDRTLMLAKNLLSSPFLATGDSMLDDGKLTALQELGDDACRRMGEIYGSGWFAVINLFDDRNETLCNRTNYPDCNYWVLCGRPSTAGRSYALPVNIFRGMNTVISTGLIGRTYVGSIKAGYYA